MKVEVIGAASDAEGVALRQRLHREGWEQAGFIKAVCDDRIRVAVDDRNRVFYATYDGAFGWGPWNRVYTNSFERFVRRMMA